MRKGGEGGKREEGREGKGYGGGRENGTLVKGKESQ